MPVTSIEAACRRCEQRFFLNELLLVRSGVCPRCGWRLTEDWVGALLDAVIRAEGSKRQLVLALRRINGLPGNIVPLPHQVVRNLIEEVGWQEELTRPGGLFAEDREALTELQAAWRDTPPDVAETKRTWRSRVQDRFRSPARSDRRTTRRDSLVRAKQPKPTSPAMRAVDAGHGAEVRPTPRLRTATPRSTTTSDASHHREDVAGDRRPASQPAGRSS